MDISIGDKNGDTKTIKIPFRWLGLKEMHPS